jgi:hypothetical protein
MQNRARILPNLWVSRLVWCVVFSIRFLLFMFPLGLSETRYMVNSTRGAERRWIVFKSSKMASLDLFDDTPAYTTLTILQ